MIDPKEVIGYNFLEVIHPDDHEMCQNAFTNMMKTGELIDFDDYRVRNVDGSWRWHRSTDAPVNDENGNFMYFVGVAQDITERKFAEEELRKLSRAVEASQVSIVITDPEGNIQYVNPKFSQITGYTSGEAIGQNPRVLKSGHHPGSFYKELWKTIRAAGSILVGQSAWTYWVPGSTWRNNNK